MTIVQKNLECEISNRLHQLDLKLSKEVIKVDKYKHYIESISSYIELIPSNGKEAEQTINTLESIVVKFEREYQKELKKSDLEPTNLITYFKEPNLGIDIIDKDINDNKLEISTNLAHNFELQSDNTRKNRSVITPVNLTSREVPKFIQGIFLLIVELDETAYSSPFFGSKKQKSLERYKAKYQRNQVDLKKPKIKKSRSENRRALTTKINEDNCAPVTVMRQTGDLKKVKHALKSLRESMNEIGGGRHIFSKAEEYIMQKLK